MYAGIIENDAARDGAKRRPASTFGQYGPVSEHPAALSFTLPAY